MTKCYEVKAFTSEAARDLCLLFPTASYYHLGNGWTRVCVPETQTKELLAYLKQEKLKWQVAGLGPA